MKQEDGHELDGPPWRRLDGTLMATARAIRQAYDVVLSEVGVTLPEASLLAFVAEAGAKTQTQIASALDAGRATTGIRIDALEACDLLERQPDNADRRVWLVVVTPKGRMLVEQINAIDADFREKLRTGISRNERRELAAILVRIRENAARTIEVSDLPPRSVARS